MDVTVVGAGIGGASAAYHLAGTPGVEDVTVYERGSLADETTAKSAAFFGFYGTPIEREMKRDGMTLYNDFLADPRGDPTYDLVGRLDVATTDGGARSLRRDETDEGVRLVAGGELPATLCFPELDASVVRTASYRPNVGYLTPRELALEFVERARAAGVSVRTDATVEGLDRTDSRVVGARVDGAVDRADAVICAAGPWTPKLVETAGVDVPLRHTLAPILRLDPGRTSRILPIVGHEESGVYLRGDPDGTVLVGYQPGGYDDATVYDPDDVPTTVPADIRQRMRSVSEQLVPGLGDARLVDQWVGVRSRTPDGHPIVGPTALDGLFVVGFHSSGIQLAPAAGAVVAGHLTDQTLPSYAGDVTPRRFDE